MAKIIQPKEIDHRIGQKVVATIEIEDFGQDFIELDLLKNGVILGDSMMFRNGRRSLLGIGTNDGSLYYTRGEILDSKAGTLRLNGLLVYMKETGEKDPLPWKADTLKYKVIKIKKAVKPNRFIKTKAK